MLGATCRYLCLSKRQSVCLFVNVQYVPFLPPGDHYPLSVDALDELGQRVSATVFIRTSDVSLSFVFTAHMLLFQIDIQLQ